MNAAKRAPAFMARYAIKGEGREQMDMSTLLVASSVAFALVLLQIARLRLRDHVRGSLFSPTRAVPLSSSGSQTRQSAAALPMSTRNPYPEE